MMYVETLSEFIEWASQFKDGQYLFRGVPNDNFEIEASAYRRLPEADSGNPSKLLRINQRLIEDARSLGHDRKNGEQLSDLELLAELQHFGARHLPDRFYTQCFGRALVCLPEKPQRGSKR